ncbi:hypothetical protein NLJ89_g379 [Agrocybe chaxingu]|uniref:Uncharacterized protein n=1 Tax=Agrocybe chaxingu TaxID=84603 RepID=A0A9W8N239_9AGAR|nr:hypothetical protein NLJ89_g379 [Agrocybe chaxingu]
MICMHPFNTWPLHVKLFTEEAVLYWKVAGSKGTIPLPPGFTCNVELEGVDGKSGQSGSGRRGPITVDDSEFTAPYLAKNTALLASGRSMKGGNCNFCGNYTLWGDVVRGCYRRLPERIELADIDEDDMFASDEDEEEKTPAPKKKRADRTGRSSSKGWKSPKGKGKGKEKMDILSSSTDSEGENINLANGTSSSDSEDSVKRRVGRPRKASALSDLNPTVASPSLSPARRRVGRPRRSSDAGIAPAVFSSIIFSAKRKVGRPRRSSEPILPEAPLLAVSPAPRKVGRPRKNSNVDSSLAPDLASPFVSPARRRVGRPRNSRASASSSDVPEDIVVSPTRRPRGRPPKSPDIEIIPPAISTPQAGPFTRGRPRGPELISLVTEDEDVIPSRPSPQQTQSTLLSPFEPPSSCRSGRPSRSSISNARAVDEHVSPRCGPGRPRRISEPMSVISISSSTTTSASRRRGRPPKDGTMALPGLASPMTSPKLPKALKGQTTPVMQPFHTQATSYTPQNVAESSSGESFNFDGLSGSSASDEDFEIFLSRRKRTPLLKQPLSKAPVKPRKLGASEGPLGDGLETAMRLLSVSRSTRIPFAAKGNAQG